MNEGSAQIEDRLVAFVEGPEPSPSDRRDSWKVLIVDDEEEVHRLTRMVLSDFKFKGRGLTFLSAYSAEEAKRMIREHRDVSLVLLDVVMESEEAGLLLVRYVREELQDHTVQVAIRTGQPGVAPERQIIEEYEINDYKEKTELTAQKLYTTVTSALRAFLLSRSLEQSVKLLERELEERRRVEQELALLATVIEQVAASVVVTDAHGVVRHVNPAFERLTGFTREEIVGRHASILEGSRYQDLFHEERLEALARDDVWQGRVVQKKKNGTTYIAEATCSPIRDSSGTITNFVSVSRDVTHEDELEAQLRHSQKMEALGTLAGGIAHDFNNVLSGILGFVDLTMHQVPSNSTAYRHLQQAASAARRAADLVGRILSFSRRTDEQRTVVSLQSTIEEGLRLLQRTLPSSIQIRRTMDETCRTVLADPTQIHQVVINLCTNASQAMEERGGVLEVGLEEVMLAPELAAQYGGLSPGPYARLSVKDTGHGMDKATIERIFDPYFTTKKPGQGTGLGLAIVHGIAASHQGAVTVDSQPGSGSVFNVFLPICVQESAPEQETDEEEVPLRGGERILFVDDEEWIVEIAKEGLGGLGYEIEAVSSSPEALAIFRANPDRFDVVITDLTMPYLTGLDLAERLLQVRPAMPVILCTGVRGTADYEKSKTVGIRDYVEKPFVSRDLAKAIRRVFDSETGAQA